MEIYNSKLLTDEPKDKYNQKYINFKRTILC